MLSTQKVGGTAFNENLRMKETRKSETFAGVCARRLAQNVQNGDDNLGFRDGGQTATICNVTQKGWGERAPSEPSAACEMQWKPGGTATTVPSRKRKRTDDNIVHLELLMLFSVAQQGGSHVLYARIPLSICTP